MKYIDEYRDGECHLADQDSRKRGVVATAEWAEEQPQPAKMPWKQPSNRGERNVDIDERLL